MPLRPIRTKIFAALGASVLLLVVFQNCSSGFATSPAMDQANFSSLVGTAMSDTTSEVMAIDANNVYSPSLIRQGGTLVMFFGGWYEPGQTHDKIYRAECPTIGTCQPAALLIDTQALGFEHLNDPSVVQLADGTYLMYMTGVYGGQDGLVAGNNHVFVSSASDAIHWSTPVEVLHDIWLPSATMGPNGHIYVYGNCSSCAQGMVRYDMGAAGQTVVARDVAATPRFYSNVEVRYRPSISAYQIVGETNVGGVDQIDYLSSSDGLNWSLQVDGVIHGHAGMAHIGTPAANPDSEAILYYAETTDPGNTQHKMWAMQWSVPTPPQPATIDDRITSLYRSILGREPELAGGLGWTAQLSAGRSLAQIRIDFAQSAESQMILNNLYVVSLGRQASAFELRARMDDLINGATLADVTAAVKALAASAAAASQTAANNSAASAASSAAQATATSDAARAAAAAALAAQKAADAMAAARATGQYQSTKDFVTNFGNLLDAHKNGATAEQLVPFINACNASKANAQSWGVTGLGIYICQ